MAALSSQNCFHFPKSDPLLQVEELLQIRTAEMYCPHILVLFPDFLASELSICSLMQTLKFRLWALCSFIPSV